MKGSIVNINDNRQLKQFLQNNHNSVFSTFRKNGLAQLSIVTVGLWRNGIAFSTPGDTAKTGNLRRDPRCSILVSADNWYPFVVFEGKAQVIDKKAANESGLDSYLREVYRSGSGKEHPSWNEFDQVMSIERRVVIYLEPDRFYGPLIKMPSGFATNL